MSNPKLPFWHTVSLSYTTYLGNFIDVLRASWLWLVLVAVLTGVASSYQWSWMATAMANLKFGPGQLSRPFEVGLLVDLDTVFFLCAGVSIAVAWHRLIIIDEHPAFSGSTLVSSSFWRYAIMGLCSF
jgi:hypothetical protein